MPSSSWFIMGHRIPFGAVEEWTIINEQKADHVFHIHTQAKYVNS